MVIQSFADVAKVIGTFWFGLLVVIGGVALLAYARGISLGFVPARVRQILSSAGYYLAVGLLLWIAVAGVIGWFVDLPGDRKPREGEPCGPGHRWTRIGPAIDPDLSCEPE